MNPGEPRIIGRADKRRKSLIRFAGSRYRRPRLGAGDFVSHGETGMLIEQKKPEQIATQVKILLDDDKLREALARNAYEIVQTKYSRQQSVSSFARLFDSIIGPGK